MASKLQTIHAGPLRETAPVAFPAQSSFLEEFGLKFSSGSGHTSRTIMLTELQTLLAEVPFGSSKSDYRSAVLDKNILGKATTTTRAKSLRYLRELYGCDESLPIFKLLRKLYAIDATSLTLLAIQVAWSRDQLLRATFIQIKSASIGQRVDASTLEPIIEAAFPSQYSQLGQKKIARNTSSSWSQSGHLTGGTNKKTRQLIQPTAVAVTMALLLGQVSGSSGAAVFASPWCELLDLNADQARRMGLEAHRAGLVNLRAIGDVVELSFPLFADIQGPAS